MEHLFWMCVVSHTLLWGTAVAYNTVCRHHSLFIKLPSNVVDSRADSCHMQVKSLSRALMYETARTGLTQTSGHIHFWIIIFHSFQIFGRALTFTNRQTVVRCITCMFSHISQNHSFSWPDFFFLILEGLWEDSPDRQTLVTVGWFAAGDFLQRREKQVSNY